MGVIGLGAAQELYLDKAGSSGRTRGGACWLPGCGAFRLELCGAFWLVQCGASTQISSLKSFIRPAVISNMTVMDYENEQFMDGTYNLV